MTGFAILNREIKSLSPRRLSIFIALLLAVATVSAYWQVRGFGFVNFDDNIYVSQNQRVQQGLTLDNLIWAFNPSKIDDHTYWHPLTWMSHMLDCELFGLNPGAHHLVNLMFHVANVLLLFFALHSMTGSLWKSGFAAGLFALHPINVDSVAWIAERKNLLSTTFWMLTILSYLYYAKKPTVLRYSLIPVSLTLGLLSKPMLVTLPCVLLLLDFWPLGRMYLGQQMPSKELSPGQVFQPAGVIRLVVEKIPLLALSLGATGLSVFSLQAKNMVIDHNAVPMTLRIENAILSYLTYLEKMIWPTDFAIFYPFPKEISLWRPVVTLLFLAFISFLIVIQTRKFPYLATGWFWYLGTLLPVIGLFQGGLWPAIADRWAYVPLIGMFIIIAWGISDLVSSFRIKKAGLPVLSVVILCVLWGLTWHQAGYWRDNRSLFEHALKVTSDNYIAHNALGDALSAQGCKDDAIQHYLQAIQINRDYDKAHNNLATVLLNQGRIVEAIFYYRQAIRINPDYADAHYNLGNALCLAGQIDDAERHFLKAIELKPGMASAHINLANAFFKQGKIDEAVTHYQKALEIQPDSAEAHADLANVLVRKGKTDQAIGHYLKAIQLNPDLPEIYNNLGVLLISKGDIHQAVQNFQKALKLKPDYLSAKNNLGKALLMQQSSKTAS